VKRRPLTPGWQLEEPCCQYVDKEAGICGLIKAWVRGNYRLCPLHDAAQLALILRSMRGPSA
jgi:hypothetical protein